MIIYIRSYVRKTSD